MDQMPLLPWPRATPSLLRMHSSKTSFSSSYQGQDTPFEERVQFTLDIINAALEIVGEPERGGKSLAFTSTEEEHGASKQ
jgi:hypothetical protein